MTPRPALYTQRTHMYLLSESSAKISKTLKKYPDYTYYVQYMQPMFEPGKNTCPFSTKACRETCLQTCGRLQWSKAKTERTDLFFNDPELYWQKLTTEIVEHQREAERKNKQLVLRLNGTSDIDFAKVWTDPRYSDVIFNEYTKNHLLATQYLEARQSGKHPNVHLTLSYSGSNAHECGEFLEKGGNVAIVFENKVPAEFAGYQVVDGDLHDFRFKDEPGTIVGLKAKSPIANKEEKKAFIQKGLDGGFIVREGGDIPL